MSNLNFLVDLIAADTIIISSVVAHKSRFQPALIASSVVILTQWHRFQPQTPKEMLRVLRQATRMNSDEDLPARSSRSYQLNWRVTAHPFSESFRQTWRETLASLQKVNHLSQYLTCRTALWLKHIKSCGSCGFSDGTAAWRSIFHVSASVKQQMWKPLFFFFFLSALLCYFPFSFLLLFTFVHVQHFIPEPQKTLVSIICCIVTTASGGKWQQWAFPKLDLKCSESKHGNAVKTKWFLFSH